MRDRAGERERERRELYSLVRSRSRWRVLGKCMRAPVLAMRCVREKMGSYYNSCRGARGRSRNQARGGIWVSSLDRLRVISPSADVDRLPRATQTLSQPSSPTSKHTNGQSRPTTRAPTAEHFLHQKEAVAQITLKLKQEEQIAHTDLVGLYDEANIIERAPSARFAR